MVFVERMGVRRALDLQVVEDAGGLPQAVQRHQRHDRRPDEKQQVRRALGVAAFHQVAEETESLFFSRKLIGSPIRPPPGDPKPSPCLTYWACWPVPNR
jgi:hypothetical protein